MKRMLICPIGIIASVAACAGAFAREPTEAPMLRIETGVHSADITGLAADLSGRFLATSSYDKTLRLWSLTDLSAPPRVIRTPIDFDREGTLYAVALSPD